MQKIMSVCRRAIDDFDMIAQKERVAVALSGGKDSMLMLKAMCGLSAFHPKNFSVCVIHIDMGFGNVKTDTIKRMCDELGVELYVRESNIAQIVFEKRREKNPCALCAKMRRGIIHDVAIENGVKKIALGHHLNDVAETFALSLLYETRLACFRPVSYLSRKDVTVIRPMIMLEESEIENAVQRLGIPIIKSPCPIDGSTKRAQMKQMLALMNKTFPGMEKRIFSAIYKSPLPGWGEENRKKTPTEDKG